MNSVYFSDFYLFWLNEMVILSKARKSNNSESHNSLKLSLRYSFDFRWMWIFPWIKFSWHSCFLWNKLGNVKHLSWQFLRVGLPSFNLRGVCYFCYCMILQLCKGGTYICTGLIFRKFWGFLFMFSTGFTSFSDLLLLPLSITF